MMKRITSRTINLILFLSIIILPFSCRRIDNNDQSSVRRTYQSVDTLSLPFRFQQSCESTLLFKTQAIPENYWFDIVYPIFQARIYCSYLPINNNFRTLNDDVRRFVYRHTVVATNIDEKRFTNAAQRTYGLLFEIEGPVASPLQFMVTDSTTHFLRGALYFDDRNANDVDPNTLTVIRNDMEELIKSINWK